MKLKVSGPLLVHVRFPLMHFLSAQVRECSVLSMLSSYGPSSGTSVENRASIVCCCNITQSQRALSKAAAVLQSEQQWSS